MITWGTVGLCAAAVATVLITNWIYRWSNPKCNGVRPPGSMGLPLIGETLHLFTKNPSLDLHPFIKKRIQRYGDVFSTSVAGQKIIVSADPQLNNFIFQQEGKSVELWYLGSFLTFFNLEGDNRTNAMGSIHKYVRGAYLGMFSVEKLKTNVLSDIEKTVRMNLLDWTTKGIFDPKYAASDMASGFAARYLFGHDVKASSEEMANIINVFVEGVLTFPLNLPGTKFYECCKAKAKLEKIVACELRNRMKNPGKGGFLDRAVKELNTDFFITEGFITAFALAALFVSAESISTNVGLIFKFLSEYPSVVHDLKAEHEALLERKVDKNAPLTWDEYKSMTITMHVINETLRLGNVFPGIMRKALKDIPYKGYTIPKDWAILVVTSSLAINPKVYTDPLLFNPSRWKDIDPDTQAKNFMPFGGGVRQCAGAELAKAFLATFLHVLISEYEWTKVKGGKVSRIPLLHFDDGIFINLRKKNV